MKCKPSNPWFLTSRPSKKTALSAVALCHYLASSCRYSVNTSPDWPSLDQNYVFFSVFLFSTVYLLAPPWHKPQKGVFLSYSVLHALKQFILMRFENRVMRLPSNGSQLRFSVWRQHTTYTLIIPCRDWEKDLLRSNCNRLNLGPDSTNPVVSLIDGPVLWWKMGAFLDFKPPRHPKNVHALV